MMARLIPSIPDNTPSDRPLCACGCGERVKKRGSTYATGHSRRSPDWKEQYANQSGAKEARRCARLGCPNTFEVWACNTAANKGSRRARYCSMACQNAKRLTITSHAWNDMQSRCVARLTDEKWSFAAFCRSVGVSDPAMRAWFERKGSALSRRFLEPLATFFGISVEQAIREAGGVTADGRHSQIGKKVARNFALSPEKRSAAMKRAWDAHPERPRKLTEDAIAKRQATREATGVNARTSERMRGKVATPDGLAHQNLYARLGHQPKPTEDELRQWAREVASTVGMSAEAIFVTWHPFLAKRKLVSKAGRKPLEARRRRVDELMGSWPHKADGDLADGFWPTAWETLKAETPESKKASFLSTPESLRLWYHQNRPPHPKSGPTARKEIAS